jgi:hypothetical protein
MVPVFAPRMMPMSWLLLPCEIQKNTGGRYNPSTDSWTATSTTNAPEARSRHTAVWTGSEMIVWGGLGSAFLNPGGSAWFNTGGRYNPNTDSWTATSTTGAPAARERHTVVWTGSEMKMIVWGGQDDTSHFNTGGRYCAAAPSPTPTPTPSPTPNHDSYTDGNCNGNGYTHGNPEDRSHAKISAHARAASVVRRSIKTVAENLVVTRRCSGEGRRGSPGRKLSKNPKNFSSISEFHCLNSAALRQNGQHHRGERTAD